MSRPATSRLKCNPPLGRMPTLQFCRPAELRIDPSYQRGISSSTSQRLIRQIAQHWNWDLCQPLVIARRTDLTERLFVIDGQHRLEAARLRGDIDQLPCVIVNYSNVADEAASFVHLNQQRQALTALDLFRAAVASEDPESMEVLSAIEDVGLVLAPHNNHTTWKPAMVSNIGGIRASWRKHGSSATKLALRALSESFKGQVLRYAGTIFPGIASTCAKQISSGGFGVKGWPLFLSVLGTKEQKIWRSMMMQARAANPDLKYAAASEKIIEAEWLRAKAPVVQASPSPPPPLINTDGWKWCEQCEMRISRVQALTCKSRFCKVRPAS